MHRFFFRLKISRRSSRLFFFSRRSARSVRLSQNTESKARTPSDLAALSSWASASGSYKKRSRIVRPMVCRNHRVFGRTVWDRLRVCVFSWCDPIGGPSFCTLPRWTYSNIGLPGERTETGVVTADNPPLSRLLRERDPAACKGKKWVWGKGEKSEVRILVGNRFEEFCRRNNQTMVKSEQARWRNENLRENTGKKTISCDWLVHD